MSEKITITKEALIQLIDSAYQGGWDSAWKTLMMIKDTAGLTDEQKEELISKL